MICSITVDNAEMDYFQSWGRSA